MAIEKPALTIGLSSRSVHEARRWAVDACFDLGRSELAECAELAVSELVTNAIVHGDRPIELRVGGSARHPRFAVRDASPAPPTPPEADDTDEQLLRTFGRGLTIVARASVAWGAEIGDDGKVVWFEPAAELSEEAAVRGVITRGAGLVG